MISEYLMKNCPDSNEGDLSRLRAAVVSEPALASIAREIGLGSYLLLGRGEAIDAPASIPCEDVTLLYKPDMPIKEFVKKILKTGFDHHAIMCYGDVT